MMGDYKHKSPVKVGRHVGGGRGPMVEEILVISYGQNYEAENVEMDGKRRAKEEVVVFNC